MEKIAKNSFLIEYKIDFDMIPGLKGVLSSHPLPLGTFVNIDETLKCISSVQPVIFRIFVQKNKLHIYYDAFRIYEDHTCCIDRVYLKQNVKSILKSLGIKDFSFFEKSKFKNKKSENIQYENSDTSKLNCITYYLYINHFTNEIELNLYR